MKLNEVHKVRHAKPMFIPLPVKSVPRYTSDGVYDGEDYPVVDCSKPIPQSMLAPSPVVDLADPTALADHILQADKANITTPVDMDAMEAMDYIKEQRNNLQSE